ncbi:excinuclease ABC subunit UvrB [Patescibacteria group bacterium]|nr:excinuclease ABC subunit UvrB [Patescibacteria group bacterium]MBU1906647.1 excinuclease ABC subunit UvrB [Patescibacteria group bacterium]
MKFKLKSKYKPAGDQPQAIEQLVKGLKSGERFQTLLGVTGSGKTFTMANVIEQMQKPTLVLAHNKTLAAQLCNEFREFFPDAAVEYFVSYYDYYQPEAYMARTDTYIEKEADVNDEIDRLRHKATQALLSRKDVIIVASVSCIYGLGSPAQYDKRMMHLETKKEKNKKIKKYSRNEIMRRLIEMQFERTPADLTRGHFRVRGDIIEIMPMHEELVYRITLEADEVKQIVILDPVTRRELEQVKDVWLFPATHFVMPKDEKDRSLRDIRAELKSQLAKFDQEGKVLEAERLKRRTRYDLEMIEQIGYCNGIENYSRHFDGRTAGDPPYTLLDYFGGDYLTVIDESHVTVPQVRGMYNGDKARKDSLIANGFRLPSARDNRPLQFPEFEERIKQVVFTTATPGDYELEHSKGVVDQVIRPTGLVDPEIIVRPVTPDLPGVTSVSSSNEGQVDDLMKEIRKRVDQKERVLVTTLTKKMAEDLSEFLAAQSIKTKYLHSGINTLDRITIMSEFRKGEFDVLVGVNLLREGLDLPEVTLVAILDADKEGFLRSETSLIQTIGRAARNVKGQVILYADEMTGSLNRAIKETERRRIKQIAYNKKHRITPKTIKKQIKDIREMIGVEQDRDIRDILKIEMIAEPHEIEKVIREKELDMKEAAQKLEFELAALLRDEIKVLKQELKTKQKK